MVISVLHRIRLWACRWPLLLAALSLAWLPALWAPAPGSAHGLTFIGVLSLNPAEPVPGAERRLVLAVEDPAGNPVAADQVAVAFGAGNRVAWVPLAARDIGEYVGTVRLPDAAGWHKLQVSLRVADAEWYSQVDVQVAADATPLAGRAFGLEHREESSQSSVWYNVALVLLAVAIGWLVWLILRRPRQAPKGE